MAVPFNVVKRRNPVNNEEKFYPQARVAGEVTLDQLSRRIERVSAASRGDVLAILTTLVDEMMDQLENGYAVRLGDLGSMRVGVRSFGEDEDKKVTADNIRYGKVIFTPSPLFKRRIAAAKFQKLQSVNTENKSNTDNGGHAEI